MVSASRDRVGHTIPLPAHRRAHPESVFDERIAWLIEAAYAEDRRIGSFDIGMMAYELFSTVDPPQPMIPNLRPDLFVSYDRARALESIVRRALSRDASERFPSARAAGDALSEAFGPYLVPIPAGAGEELILFRIDPDAVPCPAIAATDELHAIDLLIEDPERRLVLHAGPDATELLLALRDCFLRRAPILLDEESARFAHPSLVQHPAIQEGDLDLLRALLD
jgi:hypothetical protein